MRHGAKRYVYTCSHEGCTNQVRKGGVCRRHESEAKVNSSNNTATPKPDMVALSEQALGNIASIKKECDDETVGSINHDEEINDNVTDVAIKKEEDDDETVCPINVELGGCDGRDK